MSTQPGAWALVTGASSGLGAEFARQLATQGYRLILVARREDRMHALAAELREAMPEVEVRVIAMDLAQPGAAAALSRRLAIDNLPLTVLVNNAGFGLFGALAETPWPRLAEMLQLNMVALSELTWLQAREMAQRGAGYILNVSSIGAFQPSPTYAAYCATKAYVLWLGEAANFELRDGGVRVSTLCPGITATEFLEVSGQKATLYQRLVMMRSPDVVRAGLRGLMRGKPCIVPGLVNKLTVWFTRLVPRVAQTRLAYWFMRN